MVRFHHVGGVKGEKRKSILNVYHYPKLERCHHLKGQHQSNVNNQKTTHQRVNQDMQKHNGS